MMSRSLVNRTLPALPIILMMAASLSSCSAEAPAAPADPVTVLTMRVAPTEVTAADELPGRVVAFRTAGCAPVGGIVQRRLFEQGAAVRAGQMLFQISPAPSAPMLTPRRQPCKRPAPPMPAPAHRPTG